MVKKLYEWTAISTKLAGRPKTRWENYIKKFKYYENNWTKGIQDRVKWKAVVEKTKTQKNDVAAPEE
jgi:hypothetical protein